MFGFITYTALIVSSFKQQFDMMFHWSIKMNSTMPRKQEYYRGFKIIAAHYNGRFQGRAYHDLGNLSVNAGESLDIVIDELKYLVDIELGNFMEKYQNHIKDKHKAFIYRIHKEYSGSRRSKSKNKQTHCYSCKSEIDSRYDIECVACGWIVCNTCGACGCGYSAL